jgi:hypothetical protein
VTGLLIGPTQTEAIARLRREAALRPVDMACLDARLATKTGKAAHMAQMNNQTIELPTAYLVTFSIEVNHPGGKARHLSVSLHKPSGLPSPSAVEMIAEVFGFTGGLHDWHRYLETLKGHGQAVNVVQLFYDA